MTHGRMCRERGYEFGHVLLGAKPKRDDAAICGTEPFTKWSLTSKVPLKKCMTCWIEAAKQDIRFPPPPEPRKRAGAPKRKGSRR